VDVPLADVKPVVGDLVIVDRAEPAPQGDPTLKHHPLAFKDTLLYPSLGAPISKATHKQVTFFLPMVIDPSVPPTVGLELLQGGRSLGNIVLPLDRPERDAVKQVGQLPIDTLPPGVYQLRVTVKADDRSVVRTAGFTLVK
jgi:hypothetical protein